MIDTHSHLLPGVDHGSPDLETSLCMAREAAAAGITTIVCTPHLYEYEVGLLQEARRASTALKAALTAEGIDLALLLGFEATMEVVALASLDTDPNRLQTLTVEGTGMAGGGGVLVIEVPFTGWPAYFDDTVFRLTARGFVPVLAHPERNDRVQRNPETLKPSLEAGAVLQGTAGSFSPLFRRESERTFRELLARGWYSVLASDAHADTKYTYSLAPLLAELRGEVSEWVLESLTVENPRVLLEGQRPRSPQTAEARTGERSSGLYLRRPWRRRH